MINPINQKTLHKNCIITKFHIKVPNLVLFFFWITIIYKKKITNFLPSLKNFIEKWLSRVNRCFLRYYEIVHKKCLIWYFLNFEILYRIQCLLHLLYNPFKSIFGSIGTLKCLIIIKIYRLRILYSSTLSFHPMLDRG